MRLVGNEPVSGVPLIVSERAAAAMIGLGGRTLQKMRIDGSGPPFVKLTEKRVGYAVEELKRWIAARSVRSTAEATVRARREAASC